MWDVYRDLAASAQQQRDRQRDALRPDRSFELDVSLASEAERYQATARARDRVRRIEEEELESKFEYTHKQRRRHNKELAPGSLELWKDLTEEEFLKDLDAIQSNEYFRAALERHKDYRAKFPLLDFSQEQEEERKKYQETSDEDLAEGYYDAIEQTLQDAAKSLEANLGINTRVDLSTDLQRNSRLNAGDMRLEAIRKTLNSMGLRRSHFQKLFHDHFIRACLPIIYQDDWELSSERVMRELGIEEIRPEFMVITPRRFGKTYSVAMFAAAMLLHVPGVKIAVFSTGRRASSGLMSEILRRMNHVPGAQKRILKQTEEELYISATELGEDCKPGSNRAKTILNKDTTSVLKSYPAGTSSQYFFTHKHTVCLFFLSFHP